MYTPKCQYLIGDLCSKLDAKCLELRWFGGCKVCPFKGMEKPPVRPPVPNPISRPDKEK